MQKIGPMFLDVNIGKGVYPQRHLSRLIAFDGPNCIIKIMYHTVGTPVMRFRSMDGDRNRWKILKWLLTDL